MTTDLVVGFYAFIAVCVLTVAAIGLLIAAWWRQRPRKPKTPVVYLDARWEESDRERR